MKQTGKRTDTMATETKTPATGEKKTRKPMVRKPVEIAVVAVAKDSSGNVIHDATVEIIHAGKDVAAAFRILKQNKDTGADMTTFTLNPGSDKVAVEKQSA